MIEYNQPLNGEDTKQSMRSKVCSIMDAALIFLNLSTCYSIIPYLLFHVYNRYIILIIIGFLNILYILFRFKWKLWPVRHSLFGLYIIISISCVISAFFTDTGWSSALVYMFSNVSFYVLLYQLYKHYSRSRDVEHCILSLMSGYICLAALSVISVSLVFTLIKTGIISPTINLVNSMADLFDDNVNRLGQMYYFPYYLSLVEESGMGVRIPFFQDNGFVLGYFHEPNSLAFMTFPALFILLYKNKKTFFRIAILSLYMLVMLVCSSVTNIASLVCCLLLYLLYSVREDIKTFVLVSSLIFIVIALVVLTVDLEMFQFFFDKLDSGSSGYSQSTVLFAFTPRTLLGSSFYNLDYVDWVNPEIRTTDVGFVNFILNLIFMGICAVKMYKLFWKKDALSMAVFFFAAYFFLHSTKVAMVSYSLSMFIFVCFILSLATSKARNAEDSEVTEPCSDLSCN